MAEIVQLKNSNGTAIYPVTTGEAINMNNGKTLDQSFNEAKNQILLDISVKKGELATEVDAKKTEFNQNYTTKKNLLDADFTTKTADLKSDYDGKIAALKSDYDGKVSALQTDFNSKKTALKNDYDTYSTSLDINNKAGFYKGSSRITNYPIGSIIIATLIDGGVPMADWEGSYGKGTSSPIYSTGFHTYYETSVQGWNIQDKSHELEGIWKCRGAFWTQKGTISDSRLDNQIWRILLQRIS